MPGQTPTAPYAARTIANWFLAWAEGFDEAPVSNLKLQKLLYYAQGVYLARYHAPLIREPIEAWSHGPVVSSVYHHFKSAGAGALEADDEFKWSEVDDKTSELLASVWNTFGGYSAWKLREMTHRESPWVEAFDADLRSNVIPNPNIERFFEVRYARIASSPR